MTRKVLLTILALGTFFTVSGIAVSKVFADDSEFTPPIISRLAEKFNLNESDVQAVFDSVREERQVEMQERKEDRLNQAIEDGVITEDQKTALENKWQEMQSERNSEREQNQEEMQTWFAEQGIDQEALLQYGGLGFGDHKGMRDGFGPRF